MEGRIAGIRQAAAMRLDRPNECFPIPALSVDGELDVLPRCREQSVDASKLTPIAGCHPRPARMP